MQKKGGTKALFGRPNRSNRPFAFFVRIDKDFFVFCFAVFIVLCALPILRLSSMFLFCRFSFFSAKSIALFVAGRFFCCIAVAFLLLYPGFPAALPLLFTIWSYLSGRADIIPLLCRSFAFAASVGYCPLFSSIAFSVFFTDAKIPAKSKNGADLKQVQIRSVF